MSTYTYNSSTAQVSLNSGRIAYLDFKAPLGFAYVELFYDSDTHSGTKKQSNTHTTEALSASNCDAALEFVQLTEASIPNERPHNWLWGDNGLSWTPTYPLATTRKLAIKEVNQIAQQARDKFAEEVPITGDLFVIKWEQIKTYLTSGGAIPSYLQAELDARGLDSSQALTVANDVKNAYNNWHDNIGSQIEKARRTAIIAINAAVHRNAIAGIVQMAREALEEL